MIMFFNDSSFQFFKAFVYTSGPGGAISAWKKETIYTEFIGMLVNSYNHTLRTASTMQVKRNLYYFENKNGKLHLQIT